MSTQERTSEAPMLLIPEVASLLRLSQRTVRRRIADGTLPAIRIGRAVRIPESALTTLTTGAHR